MDLIGKSIGRYKVISLIDKGAMGAVYKGYHTTLGRNIAVKVMHHDIASEPDFIERFEREASIVARLRHTNILQVYDFDTIDGMYYLIMEFIDGPTLKQESQERAKKINPFNLFEIGYISHSLAAALDYAHVRQVIHRDIKPANIMLNAEGQVVLTDFGIVHLMGEQTVSGENMLVGTPAYMAPEQGQGKKVNAASDIYSMGIVLYELLTGRLPFQGNNPYQMIMQHINTPVPLLRQYNTDIPLSLETAILKALAKDPEQRFQNAGDFAKDIRKAIGMSSEQVLSSISIATVPAPTLSTKPNTEHLKAMEENLTIISSDVANININSNIGPYRGLFAFREEDAKFFFGREDFTEQLFEQVHNKPLSAVVGPSGSGKSSVVYAGLVATLKKEENWVIASFRPSDDPFQAIANSLVNLQFPKLDSKNRSEKVNQLAEGFRFGKFHLHEFLNEIMITQSAGSRLLLIADQFEELFTLTNSDIRNHFLDELTEAVDIQNFLGRQTVSFVLTLRADFLAQALNHLSFSNILQDADIKLGPMSEHDLIRAVVNPAKRLGVRFESGLVMRIVNDVGQEPGNLPLLGFALSTLWDRRDESLITHLAYEEIGGVAGALARHANEVFFHLTSEEQRLARRAFVQMVKPGEGTEDTRRIATRDELTPESWELVHNLANERLVVINVNDAGEETVEVVHEALIRNWQLLAEWMDSDRNYRAWQERLRIAMNQWQASGEDEGALLRGVLLQQALEWSNRETTVLSMQESKFIHLSQEANDRIAREKEAQYERELAQAQALSDSQRKQVRVVRLASIALGILLILTALGAIFAFVQRDFANTQANEAAAQATVAFEAQETAIANEHIAATRADEAEIAKDEARQALFEAENAQILAEDARATAEANQTIAEAERIEAVRQGHISLAQSLVSVALSTLEQNNDRELGTLLAIEAWRFNKDARGSISWYVDSALRPLITLPFFNNTLQGHSGGVNSVAFSPDGHLLASGSVDKSLRLWNLTEPGNEPLVFDGHQAPILSVVFSPDGKKIISGGEDFTIRVWDALDPNVPPVILSEHDDSVLALAVSPDGLLASSSLDGTVRLWDLAEDAYTSETIIAQDQHILGLEFSNDGEYLGLAGNDRTVQLFNLDTRNQTTLGSHDSSVIDLAFAFDDGLLASVGVDSLVKIWDLKMIGSPSIDLNGHTSRVRGVVFLPDGRIVSGGDDKNLLVWNPDFPELEPILLPGHESRVRGLALSPDGLTIASANDDNTIRLWRTEIPINSDRILTGHDANIIDVVFSQDGELMFTSGADNNVRIWDPSSYEQTGILTGHEGRVRILAISSDMLATGGDDATIRLWNLQELDKEPAILRDHEGSVRALRFTDDGKILYSAGDDGIVRSWDVSNPELPKIVIRIPTTIYSLAYFNYLEPFLAIGDSNGQIHIKNLGETEETPTIINGHNDRVNALEFSPDGNMLASASEDMDVKLWDWNDLENEPRLLAGHRGGVRGLAFSPSGSELISTGQDLTVLIWNPNKSSMPPAVINGHTAAVLGVAFSPDNSFFATVSDDKTIRLWRPLEQLVEIGCGLVKRNLSDIEWETFFGVENYRKTCP